MLKTLEEKVFKILNGKRTRKRNWKLIAKDLTKQGLKFPEVAKNPEAIYYE